MLASASITPAAEIFRHVSQRFLHRTAGRRSIFSNGRLLRLSFFMGQPFHSNSRLTWIAHLVEYPFAWIILLIRPSLLFGHRPSLLFGRPGRLFDYRPKRIAKRIAAKERIAKKRTVHVYNVEAIDNTFSISFLSYS